MRVTSKTTKPQGPREIIHLVRMQNFSEKQTFLPHDTHT